MTRGTSQSRGHLESRTDGSSHTPSCRAVTAVLLVLAALIVLSRLAMYHEPLDWDLGTFVVIGHEIRCGRWLYADIWDMKPPGIFATYALADRLVGYGLASVCFLGSAAAILTLLGVYRAAATRGRSSGLWAAALWTLVSGDVALEANRPSTEVLANVPLAWAFALLLQMRGAGAGGDRELAQGSGGEEVGGHGAAGAGRCLAIGLLFALASFYRQVVVVPAALMLAAHVLLPPPGASRRRAALQALLMLLCVPAAWAGLGGYFAASGRLALFWNTNFVYTRFYAGSLVQNLRNSLSAAMLFPGFLLALLPLAALTAVVLLAGPPPGGLPAQGPPCAAFGRGSATGNWLTRRPGLRSRLLLLAMMLGVQVAVAIPGRFHRHYYQHWMVPLAVGAGWGAVRLLALPSLRGRWLRGLAIGAVVGSLLWSQVPGLLRPPLELAADQWGSFFAQMQPTGKRIGDLLLPGETFYLWGDEIWLYALTARRPPGAGLWKMHTVEGPMADALSARTLSDLERSRPELFVLWAPSRFSSVHPLYRYCLEHYRPLPGDRDRYWPFALYMRRGGALEKRMAGLLPVAVSLYSGASDDPQETQKPRAGHADPVPVGDQRPERAGPGPLPG